MHDFENNYSPGNAFNSARFAIAARLGSTITDELNDQLSVQSAKGLEPETNGISVSVMRMAGRQSAQWIAAAGHTFVVNFSVAAIKPKTQERATGSDIAVFFEVLPQQGFFPPVLSKTLLIQAKVGELSIENELKVTAGNLAQQLRQIQRVSPNDGFLLVYTPTGAYCVAIQEALRSLIGGTIRTRQFYPAGRMLSDMVMCTAGNERTISPIVLNPARDAYGTIIVADAAQKLTDIASTLPVDEAIGITIRVQR